MKKPMPRLFCFALALAFAVTVTNHLLAATSSSDQGSNFSDEDADSDGLSNDQEAFYGTQPYNKYSDSDDKMDGEDGWALDSDLKPPRLPQYKYILIELTSLDNAWWVDSLSDKCDILGGGPLLTGGVYGDIIWRNGVIHSPPSNFSFASAEHVSHITPEGKIPGGAGNSPETSVPAVWGIDSGLETFQSELPLEVPDHNPSQSTGLYIANKTGGAGGSGQSSSDGEGEIGIDESGWQTFWGSLEGVLWKSQIPTKIEDAVVTAQSRVWSPGSDETTYSIVGSATQYLFATALNDDFVTLANVNETTVGTDGNLQSQQIGYTIVDEDGEQNLLASGNYFSALNNREPLAVVGSKGNSFNPNGGPVPTQPYLWLRTAGTWTEKSLVDLAIHDKITNLDGYAWDVNDRYEISVLSNGEYLIENGKFAELGSLVNEPSAWLQDINNNGVILGGVTKNGVAHSALFFPIDLVSKDRLLQGSIDIPDGWTNFSISIKNKTNGQDLGTYSNLEPGATTSVKIYDKSDDFFSDQEMAQEASGSLPDNVKNQKVAFARDPDHPRLLRFCTVFDELGDVEIKVTFGAANQQSEGVATCKLTRDEIMASFINDLNNKVNSVQVPGSEDVPIDTDGDGVPDDADGDGTPDGGGGTNLGGTNPGTAANPGVLVFGHALNNPANLVLGINDDNDDKGPVGHKDNSDVVISSKDNDIATILLKRPANVPTTSGTLRVAVSNGQAVRVFKPGGMGALWNYSVNLAAPSGDLAALATTGSIKLFVEGLSAASDVTITLTYTNTIGQVLSTNAMHLMVVPLSSLAWVNSGSAIRFAYGDLTRGAMRTYADNGAAIWEAVSFAPIGEEPPVRNRGMMAKVLFDVPLNLGKIWIAWPKGFVTGFWVSLKGEVLFVGSVWTFFTDHPFARAAGAWGAVQEAMAELKKIPPDQVISTLTAISKNMTLDLYTSAEQALPWSPIKPDLSPDVLAYMGGYASGTVTEGVAISLTGAGLVSKVGTTIRGVLAAAKTGGYALTALNAVRKAGAKSTHILLRLAKSEDEAARIGAIGTYLEGGDLPSGKKLAERFEEAFHDKPELTTRCLQHWDDNWKDLPPERRYIRLKLAARRVAELKELMGNILSDNGLEAFTRLQKRLFIKENIDDSDVYKQFIETFYSGSGPDKGKLNQFLEDSKSILEDVASETPDGAPPSNFGFVGATTQKTFEVGTVLDRYGFATGEFLAENDPIFCFRSLQDDLQFQPHKYYRVKKSFTKTHGRTAPWYGKPGGGLQIDLGRGVSVNSLIPEYLEEITP